MNIPKYRPIQNYLYKLSGKRLVRETSVRESDCPGNVHYPEVATVQAVVESRYGGYSEVDECDK